MPRPQAATACRWRHPCREAGCPRPRSHPLSNRAVRCCSDAAHWASGACSRPGTATKAAPRRPAAGHSPSRAEARCRSGGRTRSKPRRRTKRQDRLHRRKCRVKLIEHTSVVGNEFPGHKSTFCLGIGLANCSRHDDGNPGHFAATREPHSAEDFLSEHTPCSGTNGPWPRRFHQIFHPAAEPARGYPVDLHRKTSNGGCYGELDERKIL